MATEKREDEQKKPHQQQESQQSAANRNQHGQSGVVSSAQQSPSGMGSSQGQDVSSPNLPRDKAGAKRENSDMERPDPDESLVHDPVGAYKERP